MKLNIRKKLVSVAVASVVAGGAMMAIPAQAMNVSQNSVGQVLLYPYYSVKSGYDTVLTVVNTSAKTAVFKIRWREAMDSDEVRDFNVILSPHDVWNGAVTQAVDGTTIFRTYDKSCTSPMLPGMTTTALRAADGAKGEVPFANIGDNSAGYFEVFLMGVADSTNTGTEVTALRAGSLHGADGVPANCGAVDAVFATGTSVTNLDGQMSAPENILKGSVTYINVAHGVSFNAEPTAIENFSSTAIVFAPIDEDPSLASGDFGSTINYLDNGVAESVVAPGPSSNAVAALLSMRSVVGEFSSGTNAATSWVLTQPTKHIAGLDHTDCWPISMTLYNREEKTTVQVNATDFSPYTPGDTTVTLCPEASIIDFNGSGIFGTGANHKGVDTSSVGMSGWVNLSVLGDQDNGTSIGGVPVIGFSTIVRDSADATVNYGNAYSLAGQRGAPLAPQ
jgi:hypothetical protein